MPSAATRNPGIPTGCSPNSPFPAATRPRRSSTRPGRLDRGPRDRRVIVSVRALANLAAAAPAGGPAGPAGRRHGRCCPGRPGAYRGRGGDGARQRRPGRPGHPAYARRRPDLHTPYQREVDPHGPTRPQPGRARTRDRPALSRRHARTLSGPGRRDRPGPGIRPAGQAGWRRPPAWPPSAPCATPATCAPFPCARTGEAPGLHRWP